MSFEREEIQLKQFTSGTTLMYFSTHLDVYVQNTNSIDENSTNISPTIVELNSLNQPVRASTFDGENIWTLNDDNNYVPVTSYTNNYLTGYSYTEDYSTIIEEERIRQIESGLTKAIQTVLSPNGGVSALDPNGSGTLAIQPNSVSTTTPWHCEFVFSNYQEIDDFFVNVKLNRSYGTLDTLDIYNNLVNSIPTQEADTGVVFGRLTALQTIKDIEGNPIKIPLRNVPIGIFNPSEEYPTSSSISENGDRLFLNLRENTNPSEYFNIESFSADTQYLRSASQFTTVPDQYKYVTTTNENGEFIIYDAPIGTQIVVFEVDMFKQGLTKDEIALNFYPFPPGTGDDVVVDSVPSFSFKQFPIDVVPAWGNTQTGYTELNVTVNYDLRKWATYYVAPMAYKGNLLGSAELLNFAPSLNVDVRDMSKEGFPTTNIPIVEIQDIYDKDEDQTLQWGSEFIQLKRRASFFNHGFKAFKLRANMYDPNGYRTNANGAPINFPSQKGVWLAGYQMKMYYDQPSTTFRTTGFQRDWGFSSPGWVGRDHYHLNRGELSDRKNTTVSPLVSPPYDRPWDHNYPEPYRIPERPSDPNFDRGDINTRLTNSSNNAFLEQPLYKDGDEIGFPLFLNSAANTGGYGVQFSSTNSAWIRNRFSKEVTRSYIYKYERGVAWNEKYSNGYEPSNPAFPIDPGASSVLNGEKYQRVECGYGYWLKPEGWPPISINPWGDAIFPPSVAPNTTLSSAFGPGVLSLGEEGQGIIVGAQNQFIDVYNIEDRDLALALDDDATFSEGSLDLYRLVNPKERNDIEPEVIPTSAVYRFQSIYYQRGGNTRRIKSAVKNSGPNDREECFSRAVGGIHGSQNYQFLQIEITNNGNIDVLIPGTAVELAPGESFVFDATNIALDNLVIELPGNSNFDFGTSKYNTANYTMRFINITHRKDDGSAWTPSSHSVFYDYTIGSTAVAADTTPPNYYLVSIYTNLRTQYNENNQSCDTSGTFGGSGSKWESSVKMDGALFKTPNTNNNGGLFAIRFQGSPISSICGGESFNDGLQGLPIEII